MAGLSSKYQLTFIFGFLLHILCIAVVIVIIGAVDLASSLVLVFILIQTSNLITSEMRNIKITSKFNSFGPLRKLSKELFE